MEGQLKLITIWTDQSVYLVLLKRSETAHQIVSEIRLKAENNSVTTYENALNRMFERRNSNEIELVWLLLRESFPYGAFEEDGNGVVSRVPGQLSELWETISAKYLPNCIFTCTDIWEKFFSEEEAVSHVGSGLIFALENRGYFLGLGESDWIVRMSRMPLIKNSESVGVQNDWLQQTKMLYKNRTGMELSKLIILDSDASRLSFQNQSQVALVLMEIDESIPKYEGDLPLPLQVLMAEVVNGCESRQVKIYLIEERKCRIHTETFFKFGTALLAVGWIMIMVGACQKTSVSVPDARLLHEWEQSKQMWSSGSERYSNYINEQEYRNAELLLVGSIGQSLPEQIRLSRIRIQRELKPDNALLITLEGEASGTNPSNELHKWLENQNKAGVVKSVTDLRLDRTEEELHFSVKGEAEFGGLSL